MKTYSRRVIDAMWLAGMPARDARYAGIIRAAKKAGLDEKQAYHLAVIAYRAAKGYTWDLPAGSPIQRATKERNAAAHPYGKDAEDLLAEREGRPSRWGTAAFHAS